MPHGRWLTMKSRKPDIAFSWFAYLLLFLTILNLVLVSPATPHNRSSLKTVRLCSRSLSDALYLLCKGRGYNEPFNNNGESRVRRSPGPGLVEECCYNACSFEQMEQYCKPATTEDKPGSQVANGVIVEIVTLSCYYTGPYKRYERLRKRSVDNTVTQIRRLVFFELPHQNRSDFRLKRTRSHTERSSIVPAICLDLSR